MKRFMCLIGLGILVACSQNPAPGEARVTVLQGEAFSRGQASLMLPALGDQERVAVIPVYASQDEDFANINFSLGSSGLQTVTPTALESKPTVAPPSPKQQRTLRQLEHFQANTKRAAALRQAGTPTLKEKLRPQNLNDNCPAPYTVGTTSCNFYFYDPDLGEDKLIDTTLRFESANAYWFVDDVYADEFNQQELARLAQTFENDIVPVDTEYFGDFPDFDGNGKIFIVFSTLDFYGYVNYDDFFDDDDIFAETGYHSNEGDIFYAYLPSDNVAFGFDRERYFTTDLPSTLVHELKHLIAGGIRLSLPEEQFQGFEPSWAEEASAVAAEELSPFGSKMTGYAQSQAAGALADPEAYRLVDDDEESGPEGSSYYGYDFLFFWRVAERVGHENFWKSWTAGPETGVANVEKNAASLGSFADMMTDWSMTLMFDHTGKFPEYDYKALNLRDGSWQNIWYNAPLGTAAEETRSLAYHLGYGSNADARVTVRSSDPDARVAVVRFTGDLPY